MRQIDAAAVGKVLMDLGDTKPLRTGDAFKQCNQLRIRANCKQQWTMRQLYFFPLNDLSNEGFAMYGTTGAGALGAASSG